MDMYSLVTLVWSRPYFAFHLLFNVVNQAIDVDNATVVIVTLLEEESEDLCFEVFTTLCFEVVTPF